MNSKAYIALGSNKGDRIKFLQNAVDIINDNENISVSALSSVYESQPFGVSDQPDFLNAVILIETEYEVEELLDFLKNTETSVGRTVNRRWGPREIDLDLLFYNDIVLKRDGIKVPHEGIPERDFVLVPLCEIAGDFIHPELNEKIRNIVIRDSDKYIISKITENLIIKSDVL